MAKEWYFLLAKHCLEEFKLDCQLRRLTDRTIKGYYNNTLNFLIYAEKHHGITEVEEIYTLHIKHYVQYLLSKKLTAAYTNNILKCLRAYFRFAIQEEYIYSNPTLKVKMQREPKVLIKAFNDDEVRSLLMLLNKDMDIDLDEHDIEDRALLGYEVEYDAVQHGYKVSRRPYDFEELRLLAECVRASKFISKSQERLVLN